MAATPPGSARLARSSTSGAARSDPTGPVWVLEDARRGRDDPAIAIAERLGTEFRRVPLCWDARALAARIPGGGLLAGLRSALPLAGGLPSLTISSGRRAAAVASWLKQSCGSVMVQYGPAGRHDAAADLLVRDAAPSADLPDSVLPVLGPPHRLTTLQFRAARGAWRERLDHLPRPRLALVVGGGSFGAEMQPLHAWRLGRSLSEAVHGVEGAILAVCGAGVGREAADALASGMSGCLNLLHRQGEPGPDAFLGFVSSADAIVVAGCAPQRLLQACALAAPVYVSHQGGAPLEQRGLERRLFAAGHVRLLDTEIGIWDREPLDEAGRVAAAIRDRLAQKPAQPDCAS